MSLLRWKLHGRDREAEILKRQVTALQAALLQCTRAVQRTGFRRWLTVIVAALSLIVGFGLGLYHDPILQGVSGVMRGLGLARVQDPEVAYAAYQRGNYRTALRLLHPLAEQGNARAQSILGLMYAGGRGVPRDDAEAVKWFRRAAGKGDSVAQFQLGIMYVKGYGVPQDYDEAARWYQLAADKGNPQAQFDLALLYITGEGVPQNYISAHMWLNLAAARFPASDMPSRRMATANREFVESRMTRDQITEAQRLAREWTSK